MKKLLLSMLACGMLASAFAKNPADPCCGIIAMDIKNNLVVARDNTTGQLYQFKADNLDIKAISKGDAVTINLQTKKITGIGGAVRNYNIIQPDNAEPVSILAALRIDNAEPTNNIVTPKINNAEPVSKPHSAAPCCGVVSIEPDPVESCCGIVLFKNNSSGVLSQFRAPKNISNTIKVGDPVYVGPVSTIITPKINNAEPVSAFAIVQSSYGNNNGQMASYGYPATSGNNKETTERKGNKQDTDGKSTKTTSDERGRVDEKDSSAINAPDKTGYDIKDKILTRPNTSETDKWMITPITGMKGVLGKLNTKFPEGADWSIDVRTAAENKFITNRSSYSKHGPLQDIAPGTYNFQLNTILVENVPIEKGKETRLKAGFLNIVSSGDWHLYDETQKKFHTSGNNPKKIALPVGNYQLKLGTQFFPVVIKDGEMVEY